jgi:hypothetical protein
MIRINLTDNTFVDTIRHTREQALAAKDARIGILVGGPDDVKEFTATFADLVVDDGVDEVTHTPERTIHAVDIASIEEVPQ